MSVQISDGGSQMYYLLVSPSALSAATTNLTDIGTAVEAARAAAAGSTSQVAAAAADEVSAAIAALFGTYGQEFQALSAQASVFHDQFVKTLGSGAGPTR